MAERLAAQRVLITRAHDYMGPAIRELFEDEGALVAASTDDVSRPGVAESVVEAAGELDVLVANLAEAPRSAPVAEIADADWSALFERLVHPLMRLVRAAAPGMAARGGGRIVAVTSAAPLRGIPGASAYCAARGAQNAFVRAAGLELAPQGVLVNAIAQNYVRNDTYYPEGLITSERFRKHLERNVPAGRVAEPRETAELALFLASRAGGFLVGQVIPFAGGWATTTG